MSMFTMGIRRIITIIIIGALLLLIIPAETIQNIPYSQQLGLSRLQTYVKDQAQTGKEKVTHILSSKLSAWIESFMKKMLAYIFELIKIEVQEQMQPEQQKVVEPQTAGETGG